MAKIKSRLSTQQRSARDAFPSTRNMKRTGMQGVDGRQGSSARQVKRVANRSYGRP